MTTREDLISEIFSVIPFLVDNHDDIHMLKADRDSDGKATKYWASRDTPPGELGHAGSIGRDTLGERLDDFAPGDHYFFGEFWAAWEAQDWDRAGKLLAGVYGPIDVFFRIEMFNSL